MSVTLKRRQFMRSALAAIPAAALPFGKLFAATEVGAIDDVEALTGEGKQIILKGDRRERFCRATSRRSAPAQQCGL